MFNKLKGGEAEGMSQKDFSKKEQQAIDKGGKIEAKEHGKTAPKEIAADHVAELGAKYYNDKTGLPALERKMESKIEKANPSMQPAEANTGSKVAYDPHMSPEEHVSRVKHHNQQAMAAAKGGNPQSATWHHLQAFKHHQAAKGNPPALPEHVIAPVAKAEKGVHQPSMGSIKIGEKEGGIKGRSFAGDLVRQGQTEHAKGWHMEKLKELQEMRKKYPKNVAKSEDLQKDVVDIKTGKKVNATKKRVEAQPTGTNSGYPTPSPVTNEGKIGEVSDKVFAKFNAPKQPPQDVDTFRSERIARIKESFGRINTLMSELKQRSGQPPVEKSDKDYAPKVEEKEPMAKSIQYASGQLSKSIKSDCKDCGARQHQQWADTAKKPDSCKKCGTPMKKSGFSEEMPDSVKKMSKAENAVNSAEAEELEKATVIKPAPAKQVTNDVVHSKPIQDEETEAVRQMIAGDSADQKPTSKWSALLEKAKSVCGSLPKLEKQTPVGMDGAGQAPAIAPAAMGAPDQMEAGKKMQPTNSSTTFKKFGGI